MLDALERMLAFYEQLAEQGQGGRQSQIRVAEALRRMGDLHRSLYEYDDAEAALLQAIASLEGLIEDMPDETEPHIQHARANYTLGRVNRDMGRRDEGDPLIQFAIAKAAQSGEQVNITWNSHIDETTSNVARTLEAAGYFTGAVGKNHVIKANGSGREGGPPDDAEFLEEHRDPKVAELTGAKPTADQGDLAEDARYANKLAEMEALLLAEMRRLDDPYRLWNQPDDGLDPPVERSGPSNNRNKRKKKSN
jgi:tetratricopeptide (TPR) repeat protein